MRFRQLAMNTLAALLLLVGVVWIAQGVNVLPGSFMTGDPKWAVIGAIAVVAAIVMVILVNWRRWR